MTDTQEPASTGQTVRELIEAAADADCQCTLRQRESGHKLECWKPRLLCAIAGARSALAPKELPPLPTPFATQLAWTDGSGDFTWSQWHDDEDPVAHEWDEDPPDVRTDVYTADQMRAYARAAISGANNG